MGGPQITSQTSGGGRQNTCDAARQQGQGFILIAVLWITALLALFALYYSSSARVQGLQALNTEKWLTQLSILQSGLDWGYHEYRKYAANKDLLQSQEQLETMSGQELDLKYPRQEPYMTSIGNQTVAVQIIDLSGKMGVNTVDEERMRDILSACGLHEGVRQTTVVNSLLDWTDADDMHRMEGAEEDYYLSLDPPYVPKNSAIQSIEELLLIKGIDRELLEGTSEKPGLKDFLAVNGEQAKMDINSASASSFYIIEGIPEQTVEDIIAFRRNEQVDDLADLTDIVPQRYFTELQGYFTVSQSGKIEITASMVTKEGELGQSLTKIINQSGS
ncbi:MAG: type II secretion system protein GspK [Desulfovermiculus sp.]|nr:type II secretion system protein GspK [Desulfovermiculus sp.]